MSLSRTIARPLLSAIFLSSAIPMLKDQSYLHGQIRDAGLAEPELLAKAHVYANLAGGLALATGRFPRLAALGLAANLVPTTLVGHAYWSAPEDQKAMQKINFFKNLSLLGGLLLAAADTGGRESIPHAVGRVKPPASARRSHREGRGAQGHERGRQEAARRTR